VITKRGVKNQNHQRHRNIKGIETAKAQKSKITEVQMAMETIEIIKTTERRRRDCADLYSQTWGNGLECGTTYPGQYGYSAK
jgi:hypothetical protein